MSNADQVRSTGDGGGSQLGPLTRIMIYCGVLSIAFVLFVIWAPIDPWFREATREARQVDDLFKFMLATSGIIFIYVQGMVVGFALQYRRRKSDPEEALGAQIHGNTRLEIAWTVAPAILLVVLSYFSLQVWGTEHAAQADPLRLDVTGYQYGYSFSLPQYGIKDNPTVYLPAGRPVYVTERAKDVIHAFWVPNFRIQMDMVPGVETHEQFTPSVPGTYRVVCTQFCGVGHSLMAAQVTVATQGNFVSWLRKNGATSLPSGSTAAVVQQHS